MKINTSVLLESARITPMNDFIQWLTNRMEEQGWKGAELARRSGLDASTITTVLNGTRGPGIEFCVGIGRAFGMPPEQVLRKAKLLPPASDDFEEKETVLSILGKLSWSSRQTVLGMLRGLARNQGILTEPGVPYDAEDPTTGELVRLFGELPEDWKDAALEQVRQLNRMARGPTPRIIGEEE